MQTQPKWKSTDHTEKNRRKPGRMAERSKAPDSRNSSVENSGPSVCVGSSPNPVRKRFEQDEAEALADKFYHTGTLIEDDSPKQKQKNRNVIRGRWPSGFEVHEKEDTRRRYQKNARTCAFKRKSLKMEDANHAEDYISELKMLPEWHSATRKQNCRRKPGRMAEKYNAPGSRFSSREFCYASLCVGSEPTPVRKILNRIKQNLQLTNSLKLELQSSRKS